MAEEAVLEGRQTGWVAAGWGGGPGRVAGRVRCLAGSGDWTGGKAGQVVGGGVDLWGKECSGVNIVT